MKQDTMDIGFRKRKVDILKKRGRLALRPLRQEGRLGSCRTATLPNHFVVGSLNFYHDCKEELAKGASLILVCAQHGHLAGGRCNSEAEVQAKCRIDCCGEGFRTSASGAGRREAQ